MGKRGWTIRLSVIGTALLCAFASIRSFHHLPLITIYESPGLHGDTTYAYDWPLSGIVLMAAATVLLIGAVSIWPRRRNTIALH